MVVRGQTVQMKFSGGNMKKFIVTLLAAVSFAAAAPAAAEAVRGYTRKDGTYVAPHYRSAPNSTTSDNYSTRGNYNPYTGEAGTKPDTRPSYGSYSSPYKPYEAPKNSVYGSPSATPYGVKPKAACTSVYGC
jgi:hypothetical protein